MISGLFTFPAVELVRRPVHDHGQVRAAGGGWLAGEELVILPVAGWVRVRISRPVWRCLAGQVRIFTGAHLGWPMAPGGHMRKAHYCGNLAPRYSIIYFDIVRRFLPFLLCSERTSLRLCKYGAVTTLGSLYYCTSSVP